MWNIYCILNIHMRINSNMYLLICFGLDVMIYNRQSSIEYNIEDQTFSPKLFSSLFLSFSIWTKYPLIPFLMVLLPNQFSKEAVLVGLTEWEQTKLNLGGEFYRFSYLLQQKWTEHAFPHAPTQGWSHNTVGRTLALYSIPHLISQTLPGVTLECKGRIRSWEQVGSPSLSNKTKCPYIT